MLTLHLLPIYTCHCFTSLSSFCTLRIRSDQLFLCFVCYPCIISSYPFDCPVHPDALHPPSNVVSSSCATPSCSYYPLLLCRQMAGCRPARREPANLPAGIAAKRGQDGCWGREGIDGWSPPRLGCSGRGNHAQESGQSVPDAGRPCTQNSQNNQRVTQLTRRERTAGADSV